MGLLWLILTSAKSFDEVVEMLQNSTFVLLEMKPCEVEDTTVKKHFNCSCNVNPFFLKKMRRVNVYAAPCRKHLVLHQNACSYFLILKIN